RPEQVARCYQAACNNDFNGVKEQVEQLLHNRKEASAGDVEPHPAWLFSSLGEAIRQKNVEMVQYLLDENVGNGKLPVDVAVRCRAYEILELFLRYGWNINEQYGRNSPAALSTPVCTADAEMVTWLLDHGADPNAQCEWDFTPTSYAMYMAPLPIIDMLFQRGASVHRGQLLHYAVIRDKPNVLQVVQQLVEKGAPANEVKYEKEPRTYWEREPFGLGTPLHRAAEFGKVEVVRYLLKVGADPLKLDSRGRTPHFWAEKNGHAEV
ncbi:ankyrin, partial [Aaosphaeria arxii CBS 175.79]